MTAEDDRLLLMACALEQSAEEKLAVAAELRAEAKRLLEAENKP